ncbi:MAG TPA: hypothetical protein VM571_10310 [Noviherbaspirillum sp.]|nr:hypothetical protein [Noviherbaspirillum sp.]
MDLVVDGLKKVLHNLVSLLLTNKTIRSEAQKVGDALVEKVL